MGQDSIFYEWAGSGPCLILIHDGMLHRELWDAQFDHFSSNYRVIRYDRRGYGASSPATEVYTHLKDLNALFGETGTEHALLVACSSGGALAIVFTLTYPQKVDGLVLVGAVVGGFSYTAHMRNRGGHLPGSFDSELEESLYYALEDPYEIHPDNREAREKAQRLLMAFPPKKNRRQDYSRPEVPAFRRLHEINVPALVLVGASDIPDVHAHAGAINAGIPESKRIVVPGSGHLVPLEQPEVFNALVSDFLFNFSL